MKMEPRPSDIQTSHPFPSAPCVNCCRLQGVWNCFPYFFVSCLFDLCRQNVRHKTSTQEITSTLCFFHSQHPWLWRFSPSCPGYAQHGGLFALATNNIRIPCCGQGQGSYPPREPKLQNMELWEESRATNRRV